MYVDLKPYLTDSNSAVKISLLDLKKQGDFGNTCFLWNGSIYYPKATNLNELIGEQLAKKIHLRTVNYDLFEDDCSGKIIIASKSFLNPTSKYPFCLPKLDLNNPNNNNLKDKCIDDDNYQQLLINIFKMFAVDIYMGQNDRCYLNFQFEEYDSGYFDLAPLYDYSDSRWNSSLYYDCELYNFYSRQSYENLFDNYPKSLEIIQQMKQIDLKRILEKIEQTKGIKLPQEIIDIYLQREEIAQRKLEKIIN